MYSALPVIITSKNHSYYILPNVMYVTFNSSHYDCATVRPLLLDITNRSSQLLANTLEALDKVGILPVATLTIICSTLN